PDPGDAEMAANLARLVALGMMARAICDGWLRVLYGAGHIHRYAPVVVGAGFATPIGTVILLLTLPEPIRYMAPAAAYAAVLLVAYLGLIPRITARALGVSVGDVLSPLIRPAAVALAIVPILVGARFVIHDWNFVSLGAVGLAAGTVYAGLAWIFVVEAEERRRLRAGVLGRLGLAH